MAALVFAADTVDIFGDDIDRDIVCVAAGSVLYYRQYNRLFMDERP